MGHVFFYPAVRELRRHGGNEALRPVPHAVAGREQLDMRLVRVQVRPAAALSGSVRVR
jgi:hypothetical protein